MWDFVWTKMEEAPEPEDNDLSLTAGFKRLAASKEGMPLGTCHLSLPKIGAVTCCLADLCCKDALPIQPAAPRGAAAAAAAHQQGSQCLLLTSHERIQRNMEVRVLEQRAVQAHTCGETPLCGAQAAC